jgi:xanthine phosphoribosyltransferase
LRALKERILRDGRNLGRGILKVGSFSNHQVGDFLASGQAISALVCIVCCAGAELVGIGALIEKAFEGGHLKLATLGVPLHALVTIASMSDGQIVFED